MTEANWERFKRLQGEFTRVSEEFETTDDVNLRRLALDKMHEVVAEMDAINDSEHQRLQETVQKLRNAKAGTEKADKAKQTR